MDRFFVILLQYVLIWTCVYPWGTVVSMHQGQRSGGDAEVPVKGKVEWIRFLVTVDATRYKDCIPATVLTPHMKPDQHWNNTIPIISSCDKGPLTYQVYPMMTEWNVRVTYYTTTIDVEPPYCDIPLPGRYLTPKRTGTNNTMLYGCYFNDSREGYHVTDYWIYILDWHIVHRKQGTGP